jgi:AmmeMemoRadiSam system protein B
MLRQPAVAGYFYPAEKTKLLQELSELIPARQKSAAKAIAVPHAGYIYSGHVAGEVYASVDLPDSFIILCPNHTGSGRDFDLWPEGEWLTPLGKVRVDGQLTAALLQQFPAAEKDGLAHLREHSLEVQLPFLQYSRGDFSFVALCIRQFQYPLLEELGHAIANVVRAANRSVLIVASTDMTHYESQESANRKDRLAIEQMERLDARGLYDTVHRNDISMCGYLPTTAAMIAARDLGATSGVLKKYATSGDITGDYRQVVGYAGMIFS